MHRSQEVITDIAAVRKAALPQKPKTGDGRTETDESKLTPQKNGSRTQRVDTLPPTTAPR
eukprot:3025374-Rhodomonas_salina.1